MDLPTGHLKRLNGNSRSCNVGLRKATQKNPGVYILWWHGKVVYVGQSKNCDQRIEEHQHKQTKKFDYFQVFCIPNERKRLTLETELINYLRPIENRHIPNPDPYNRFPQRPKYDWDL
jgi:excinuclease UvrABC nuclease subunit